MSSNPHLAAIGTYSAADEPGVYTVDVDTDAAEMEILDKVVAGPDPTFVAPHPTGKYLYAAVRTEDEGTIKTYEVDRATGTLTEIHSAPSGALSPCHCSVDPAGEFLFVAHYTGGAVSMLPLGDNGQATSPVDVVQHTGSSVHPDRQTSPHPHSISPGPNGRFVYVPDLGTDEVVIYEVNRHAGRLSSHTTIDVYPGAGPRHLSFDPNSERVYLINELDSTVIAFALDEDGTLSEKAAVSTLPDDFDGENKTAEIATHPSGRYIFASNRGHNTITTLSFRDKDLHCLDHTPTGGTWPRHFAVSPDGRSLFVENRNTDEIVALAFDEETGVLTRTESILQVSQPVCLRWLTDMEA